MKYWYKGESWRLLPNIEFYSSNELLYIDLCWLKFSIGFIIGLQ